MSELYRNFTGLLSIKHAPNETFKNFEYQFFAQKSKISSNYSSSKLTPAFILLAESDFENGQRIFALAAASHETSFYVSKNTDQYLVTVSYGKAASVLRECEQVMSDTSPSIKFNSVHVEYRKSRGGRNKHGKSRLAPTEIDAHKGKN